MDVITKPLALALTGCLAFTGCQAFRTSDTWHTVMKVRPDTTPDEAGSSHTYAAKLHRVLRAEAVEHKVVTYQFHYQTHLREEAVCTRTAVLYRDNHDSRNPWWLMEDNLAKPVWVPGENPQKQVAFYLRHDAEVVDEKNYQAGSHDHKSMVAFGRTSAKQERVASASTVRFRTAPVSPRHEFAVLTSKTQAQPDSSAARFREIHGTEYDPSSQIDREKMTLLRSRGEVEG